MGWPGLGGDRVGVEDGRAVAERRGRNARSSVARVDCEVDLLGLVGQTPDASAHSDAGAVSSRIGRRSVIRIVFFHLSP